MAQSISDNKKSRGRPRTTGISPLVGVRLPVDILDAVDTFRSEQTPEPTRPEAVRVLLRDALTAAGYLELPPDKEDAN